MDFIILRYIDCKQNNIYWNICVDKVQNLYPDSLIYIIDDHSKCKPQRIFTEYKQNNKQEYENIKIINSELEKGRGELLPYYYMYKYKLSKKIIFLQDTHFLEEKINENIIYNNIYAPLWVSNHDYDNENGLLFNIKEIITQFNDSEDFISYYIKLKNWDVIFGGMVYINLNFLEKVFENNNYLEILINTINTRKNRMAFERIIGCLLRYKQEKLFNDTKKANSINGNIHNCGLIWGSNYLHYKYKTKKNKMEKIWIGRENKNDIQKINSKKSNNKNHLQNIFCILFIFVIININKNIKSSKKKYKII